MPIDTDKTVLPENLADALIGQFESAGLQDEHVRIDREDRVVIDMTARTSIRKVADNSGRLLAEAHLRGWRAADILWPYKKVVLTPVD